MTAFGDQSASVPGSRGPMAPNRDGSTGRIPPLDDATVISSAAVAPGHGSSAEIGLRLQGTMLGPYRLDTFIGGGGMGAVFRALDTTLDRIVAVKVLAGSHADDEEMLRRFRNEAQSAARLDHENIGRVFAVGSEGGWHFIVFEFIEGQNLRDLVREQGAFDLGRTIDVAVQVADALEHASQRDVVHRDIKPSNIVITPGGKARIVDMGLARLHQFDRDGDLTASGVTLGTFDYISPEQARDSRTADVRSDLYSLGCTMFFMLAGRPPFADGGMVQKLLQHQQEPPPAIDTVRADVPRAFGGILARLMEKDPADRYQRPAELVADLLSFADSHGHVVAAQRTAAIVVAPVSRRRPATRLPWLVPLLGLVATVGGLWLQAAATRSRSATRFDAASADAVTASAAPVVIRLGGSLPEGASPNAGSLAADFTAAMKRIGDGDVLELAFDGALDVPAISLAGKKMTIRAAAGVRPALRFVSLIDRANGTAVACDIGAGRLSVEGVALRLAADASAGRQSALFAIASGSLACIDALLVMPSDTAEAASAASDTLPVFVAIDSETPGRASGDRPVASLSFDRTRACGDAVFLHVGGTGGLIDISWFGGGLLSPHPWIVADGGSDAAEGVQITAVLSRAVFACRGGLVFLMDSLSQPGSPRLDVVATACEFLVEDSPLVRQSGIGELIDYDTAFAWRDEGSLYEGSSVMRQVEGAGERVDVFFRDQPVALRHAETVSNWPEAPGWEAAWEGGAD
jgi:hypothetical protein